MRPNVSNPHRQDIGVDLLKMYSECIANHCVRVRLASEFKKWQTSLHLGDSLYPWSSLLAGIFKRILRQAGIQRHEWDRAWKVGCWVKLKIGSQKTDKPINVPDYIISHYIPIIMHSYIGRLSFMKTMMKIPLVLEPQKEGGWTITPA